MQFYLGYFIQSTGQVTYHYGRNRSRTLCGIENVQVLEFRETARSPEALIHGRRRFLRFNRHRRYCKTCLRILKNARDIVTRLAELSGEEG